MLNSRFHTPSGSNRRMVGVGVGFGLLTLWFALANTDPVVAIPNPAMPTLNAFDFYVRAGDTLTGDKQIADAVSPKPTRRYSPVQKEALVRQNVGVVNTLHEGFAYPYRNPPVRSLSTELPYYKKFRVITRLLALRGQVRAEQGDWSGAVESYLDALRFGEDIPHGSPLVGELVGIWCQETGRRPIWNVVEHLNAAQSRAAIARLISITDRHLAFADAIQEDKWTGQAERLELFHGTQKADPTDPDDGVKREALSFSPIYLFRSKHRIMDDFANYMDQNIRLARQPFSLRKPSPPVPTDMLNSVLTPVLISVRVKDVASETRNGLLLVALALHAFRLEHGHYPAALAALAPSYLKKLPEDPFTVQNTFQYHIQGKSYILYSVGPDGTDDAGTPIDDAARMTSSRPEARYDVDEHSVGDVVAGINR